MDFHHSLHRHPLRLARSRGFTLIELMVVVVIIGILSSIAVPGVVERLRERRANQTAQEIALVYRDARMRALGHGSAVLVHFDNVYGFSVREAVLGASAGANGCAAQPAGGCLTNDWTLAAQYSVVDQMTPFGGSNGRSENTDAGLVTHVNEPGTNDVGYLDVCFTPRGRAFSRDAASSVLTQLSGVVTVNVSRGAGSLTRTVIVPPSGIARVAL